MGDRQQSSNDNVRRGEAQEGALDGSGGRYSTIQYIMAIRQGAHAHADGASECPTELNRLLYNTYGSRQCSTKAALGSLDPFSRALSD